MELETGGNDAGRRLDRILRKALPEYPLSLIHRLLRQGRVLVDGKPARGTDRPPACTIISIAGITAGEGRGAGRKPAGRGASGIADITPWILWQGAGLLILNKPAGVAVHGHDSLDSSVQTYLAGKLPPSLSFRPGPLHRLDKPTSGVIVFSTSIEGARWFSALLRERRVRKYYLALVEGRCAAPREIWEDTLVRDRSARKTIPGAAGNGKTAVTIVRTLAATAAYSLLLAEIDTGRTHQIRTQAALHGHPLAGDAKYGGRLPAGAERGGSFYLHAWKLEWNPGPAESPSLPASITAPLPEPYRRRIESLFGTPYSPLPTFQL